MSCIIIREYSEKKNALINGYVHVTKYDDGIACSCRKYANKGECDHLIFHHMVLDANPTKLPMKVK